MAMSYLDFMSGMTNGQPTAGGGRPNNRPGFRPSMPPRGPRPDAQGSGSGAVSGGVNTSPVIRPQPTPHDRPQASPLPAGQKQPPKNNPWIPPRRPLRHDAQGSGSGAPSGNQQAQQGQSPNWWQRNPNDITELLRQLSVNAGQMGMPGGMVGAVQKPAYGTIGQAMIPQGMQGYGQTPNMGEATFFQQGMNGGMAPIAAMSPLGVPAGWNPLGQQLAQKPSRPNRPPNRRNQGNGIMDGWGIVDGRIGVIGLRPAF